MIGSILSNYKLIDKIGAGGMSIVYLGRHIKNGSVAAIKVLKEHHGQDKDYIRNFFTREIEVTKKLDHTNIVKLLGYGEKNNKFYLVYEYIDGISLDRYLKNKKKIPVKTIEKIARQILSGLSHAHSLGVIHRDIKPQNIIITESEEVKITDFGIAKAVSNTTITQTGLFMGSPAYISPEQAEGKEVSNASDIYSLGIIIFEMLARKLPFTANTTWGVINKQINKPPPDIKMFAKNIPEYLSETVSRCLKKNPQERFDSAEEIIDFISNKGFSNDTVVKKIRDLKKENGLSDEIEVKDTSASFIQRIKSISKKKLAIGIGIATVTLWFFIGSMFYFTGNKYYNEDRYFRAAVNFRIAEKMLIPNAGNSKILSLGLFTDLINKLISEEEYEDALICKNALIEEFPGYDSIEDISYELSRIYEQKKEEYTSLLDNENFIDAGNILMDMKAIKDGNDDYVTNQMEVISRYSESEELINDAFYYLENGDYLKMNEMIDMAEENTPDYSGISDIKNRIVSENEKLKISYENNFNSSNFSNCLEILNKLIELNRENSIYIEEEIQKVYLCQESEQYIEDAKAAAENKDFDSAYGILETAIEKNPEYENISTEYDLIKELKNNYDSYINKINHVANLNNSANYLEAYNQANNLLNDDIFIITVSQQDIDYLNNIKSSAYNSGKNIPGNSVSFNLYDSNQIQSKNINNIFGQKIFQVNFGGRTWATDKSSRFISCMLSIGEQYNINLMLYTTDSLIYANSGDNIINTDRKSYLNSQFHIAQNGATYSLGYQNRNFIVVINSMSKSNYWFESLIITVNVQ